MPLLDAIGGDRLDVVPLLGAMVRCDGKMPWWVSLFGAIAACWPFLTPCGKVPLLGAIAGCNRLDVVPLLGGMVRCHGKVPLLDAMVGAMW